MTDSVGLQFAGLLPQLPLLVGRVTAVNGDGTSTVAYANGATVTVRGTTVAAGHYAFIRDGEIRGEAPAVTPVTLDV